MISWLDERWPQFYTPGMGILFNEIGGRGGLGLAEEPADLGGGFGFVLVLDVGGDGGEGCDEGSPIVGVACAGENVRDHIGREDEVSECTDDDAFGPCGGVAVLEAVEEDERGEDGLAAGGGGDPAEGAPEAWRGKSFRLGRS